MNFQILLCLRGEFTLKTPTTIKKNSNISLVEKKNTDDLVTMVRRFDILHFFIFIFFFLSHRVIFLTFLVATGYLGNLYINHLHICCKAIFRFKNCSILVFWKLVSMVTRLLLGNTIQIVYFIFH